MTTDLRGTGRLPQVSDLLADRDYHIEFNGHLTNHVKHAVVALAATGAPERLVRDYYADYAALTSYGYGLEPRRESTQDIHAGNWRDFVGERAHFTAYCRFFDQDPL